MPEFGVSFNYDDGGISKSIADQAEQLKRVNKELLGYEKEINNIAKNNVKALNESEKALANQSKAQLDSIAATEKAYNHVKNQIGEIAIALTRGGSNAEKFNAIVKKLGDARAKGLAVDIDEINQEFQSLIENAGLTTEQLKIMEIASEEVTQLLAVIAESDISELGEQAEKITKEFVSSKSELRELTALINSGQLEGKDLQVAKDRAAELTDTIGDVREEIKNMSSDTKNIDTVIDAVRGLTAIYGVAEGAAAIFGDENEDVQKALLKLNAIMAISNSIQEAHAVFLQNSTLKTRAAALMQGVYTTVVGASTGALKLFRIALALTGIGFIVILLGALVTNWSKVSGAVGGATGKLLNWTKNVTQGIPIIGTLAKGLDFVFKNIEKVGSLLDGVGASISSFFSNVGDGLAKFFSGDFSGSKDAFSKIGEDSAKAFTAGYQSAERTRLDTIELENIVKVQKRKLEIQQAGGNDSYKLQKTLADNEIKLLKLKGATKEEIEEKEHERTVQNASIQKALADKAKEARDKQLKDLKDFNSELSGLRDKLVSSKIDNIDDSTYEGQIQKYNLQVEAENKAFEESKKISLEKAKTKEQELAITTLYKDLEIELTKKQNDRLVEIEKERIQKKYEQLKEDKELIESAIEQAIELDKIKIEQANKDKEDAKEFQFALLDARIAAYEDELKYGELSFEQRKKIEIAKQELVIKGLELQRAAFGNVSNAETIKLDSLISSAKKGLDQLNKEVEPALKNSADLFNKLLTESFGLTGPQAGVVVDAFQQTKDAILGIINEAYEAEIESLDKSIDVRKERISEIEGLLNEEYEAKQNGYANSYDALLKSKDEEQALLKEDQKKKIAAQKEQLQINTAIQAAQQAGAIATAISNAIAQSSTLGPFGYLLAIPAIIGIFSIWKKYKNESKALTAQAAYNGGLIGDYINNGETPKTDRWNGRGHIVEGTNLKVGADEFITNAVTTQKHLPFMKLLNSGKLDNTNLMRMIENSPNDKLIVAQINENKANELNQSSAIAQISIDIEKALSTHLDKHAKRIIDDNSRRPTVINKPDGTVEVITYEKNGVTKRILRP